MRVHDFPFVHTVALEVTSNCKLRCTYCMVSQPGYEGRDMPAETVDALVGELRQRKLRQLCINGHGETTNVPGWSERFRAYVDEFEISLTTSLARRMHAHEIDFLSRIHSINLSLDSIDPELLSSVRRRTNLAVVLENVARIRAAAVREERTGPKLILFAGVYDRSVTGLEDLASMAAVSGFSRVVFWSLVKHPDVPDVVNVNTIETLDPEAKLRAAASIEKALAVLARQGVEHEFVGDFFAVFKRSLETTTQPASAPPPRDNHAATANRIFEQARVGFTRDCFDPWNYSQIKENGDVYPCCAHGPIGNVARDGGYAAVLDGDRLRVLRQRLIDGDLDAECANCHMRRLVPVTELQARYRDIFRKNVDDRSPVTLPPWVQTPDPPPPSEVAAVAATSILANLDYPLDGQIVGDRVVLKGWLFSSDQRALLCRIRFGDDEHKPLEINRPRPDVVVAFAHLPAPEQCGFVATFACAELPFREGVLALRVEIVDDLGETRVLGPVQIRLAGEAEPDATRLVAEQEIFALADLVEFGRSEAEHAAALIARLPISPSDVVVELGCGAGRMGSRLAPYCREWIGVDKAPAVLETARAGLAALGNVRLLQNNGRDLSSLADASADCIYCTLIFAHLSPWERFGYVREALRVLRPGGRFYVDTLGLSGRESWDLFEMLERILASAQPANALLPTTEEELSAYFARAGFEAIESVRGPLFVEALARKPDRT